MTIITLEIPESSELTATLEPVEGTFTVTSNSGVVLCKSSDVLRMCEVGKNGKYPPVLYLAKSDVSDQLVHVEGRSTHCPVKGDASYFSFEGTEVAWIYDRTIPTAEILNNYVAFYSDKVTFKKS